MIARWTDLVPRAFPELHLVVRREDLDLLEHTRDFDFSPLLEVHRFNSPRKDLDFDRRRWFVNASRFEAFRAAANCYTYFTIAIARDRIEIATNYGDLGTEGPVMDLLRTLLRVPGGWRYEAWSSSTDSGEASEAREGDLADAVGLRPA